MSRFYKVVIQKKDVTEPYIPPSMEELGLTKYSYSSVDDGDRPLRSALDVSIDVMAHVLAAPRQGSMIRIFGVSLDDISQFTVLVGATLKLYAGMMKPGLPLAKHFEPDLLMQGTIWWTAGNWEAPTNLSLDLFIVPLVGIDLKLAETVNLTFIWTPGTPLAGAVAATLNAAYGKGQTNQKDGYDIIVSISDDLATVGIQAGATYGSLSQFAKQLNDVTKTQKVKMPDDEAYGGVNMRVVGKKIIVYDNSKPVPETKHTKENPLAVDFIDLIGQPTWKTGAIISFKTVMRADMQVGDYITLPQALGTPYVQVGGGTNQNSAPNSPGGLKQPSKNRSTFTGKFRIMEVHHIGQFRQADGRSWVTAFDAVAIHKEVAKKANEERPKPQEPLAHPPPPGVPGSAQTEPPPGSAPDPTNPLHTPPGSLRFGGPR